MSCVSSSCSYRDNPTLGDPNTLIEELLEMRNKIRVKEAELVMIRAKVGGVLYIESCIEVYVRMSPSHLSLFSPPSHPHNLTQLNMFTVLTRTTSPEMSYQLSSPLPPSSSPPLTGGHPRKSSAGLVGGKDHDFVESEKRRPALCAYCGGMIQRELSEGVRE